MANQEEKTYVGLVVSDKMDKTVVVTISRRIQHPLYNKTVKRQSRFKAHDETNQCGKGDTVMMVETRPLSKGKRFEVLKVIEKAAITS